MPPLNRRSKKPDSNNDVPLSFSAGELQNAGLQNQPLISGGAQANAQGNSGGGNGTLSSGGPMVHRFTLEFPDETEERDYEKYFFERNYRRWRNGVLLVLIASTLLYIYGMLKSPADNNAFRAIIQLRTGSFSCPPGYFCSECFPSNCMETYEVWKDVVFLIICVIIPGITALTAHKWLHPSKFARYIHLISAFVVTIGGVLGLTVRFFVVEPKSEVYVSGMIQAAFLFAYFLSLRVRFLYATISCAIQGAVFIVVNGYRVSFVDVKNTGGAMDRWYPLFVCAILLLASNFVISFTLYEQEILQRTQFQAQRAMERANYKLNHQLKVIQKTTQLNQQNALKEFDSPLERSIEMLRSCMAETTLSPHITMRLGHILQLLTSSNLLTPDVEKDLSERGARLDNEQEAWLFSEIARRRADQRGRASSSSRRRGSVVAVASANNGNAGTVSGTSGSIPSQQSTPQQTSIAPPASALAGSAAQESAPQRRMSLPFPNADAPASKSMSTAVSGSALPNNHSSMANSLDTRSQPELDSSGMDQFLPRLNDYNFPIFAYTDATNQRPLSSLMYQLFRRHNLLTTFQIPVDKFMSFVMAIECGYHSDLPYHNRIHATDVLHSIACFTQLPEVVRTLSDLDLMGIFVSAAIHDYDHPGFNNLFLINTQDPKAILYNDKAVLENHHLASAFTILRKSENNFISHLSKSDYKALREIIIEMVLATDLAQHLPIISMFKNRATQGNLDPESNREDRTLLFKMMMKCSDVGNPTKEWSIYEVWQKRIIDEFFRQGDTERRMGLDVSPFMDREKVNVASSQLGFIDFVVSPLFNAFNMYAPIAPIMQTLATNREIWAERVKSSQPTPAPAPAAAPAPAPTPAPAPAPAPASQPTPVGNSTNNFGGNSVSASSIPVPAAHNSGTSTPSGGAAQTAARK